MAPKGMVSLHKSNTWVTEGLGAQQSNIKDRNDSKILLLWFFLSLDFDVLKYQILLLKWNLYIKELSIFNKFGTEHYVWAVCITFHCFMSPSHTHKWRKHLHKAITIWLYVCISPGYFKWCTPQVLCTDKGWPTWKAGFMSLYIWWDFNQMCRILHKENLDS